MDVQVINIAIYKYNEDYAVEVTESTACDGEEYWEAWLSEKDYGFKSFIIGYLKKDFPERESFVQEVFNNMEETLEQYEEDKMLLESDRDVIFNRPVDERFNELFDQVLNNCRQYEINNSDKHLLNEVGCLRGLMYAMEKVGLSPISEDTLHFMDKSLELMKDK